MRSRTLDAAWALARDEGYVDQPDRSRLASLVIVGRLMARAALRREESRGGHYRFDFPARDDASWRHRVAERTAVDADEVTASSKGPSADTIGCARINLTA